MIIALFGATKPQAGVITTRPATMPEQKPRTEGLPLWMASTIPHTKPATAAASVVVVKAFEATPSAESAEPALKPYQPTHSMPVPTIQSTIECGAMGWLPYPRRLPRMIHNTRALQPEV